MAGAENELICDFAEAYRIYDYRALRCDYAATLAMGLRESSRVKMKMAGMKVSTETYLLAAIADRLSLLVWFQTKDGSKGRHRPESFTEKLSGCKSAERNEKPLAFNTPEELDRALAKFRK